MQSSIKIFIVPLAISLGVWYFALRPKQSAIVKILETVPLWQEQKGKIFKDAVLEIGKIAGIYTVLIFSGLYKSLT